MSYSKPTEITVGQRNFPVDLSILQAASSHFKNPEQIKGDAHDFEIFLQVVNENAAFNRETLDHIFDNWDSDTRSLNRLLRLKRIATQLECKGLLKIMDDRILDSLNHEHDVKIDVMILEYCTTNYPEPNHPETIVRIIIGLFYNLIRSHCRDYKRTKKLFLDLYQSEKCKSYLLECLKHDIFEFFTFNDLHKIFSELTHLGFEKPITFFQTQDWSILSFLVFNDTVAIEIRTSIKDGDEEKILGQIKLKSLEVTMFPSRTEIVTTLNSEQIDVFRFYNDPPRERVILDRSTFLDSRKSNNKFDEIRSKCYLFVTSSKQLIDEVLEYRTQVNSDSL